MELLSPAGTLEAGLAAFHYGADAVYLGMKEFSARADAGNFSLDDLEVLLGIAHGDKERPRKVYVAVNTLVREAELPRLVELLAQLCDVGVDALITQDMAVAELVRTHFPGLALHASTQMAIHNVAGVRQAQRLGFTRVVAAREVTVAELREMAAVPGMEIEAFIHGALCWSYSGLCLLSACLNGPSGNRGDCTYVCRNHFRVLDERGVALDSCCPLSMKDLALAECLPALRKAGVVSLKIEGRKKTPLFVAAVTNYYRKLLDGTFRPGEAAEAARDVQTIFSRPWTELYARGVRGAETVVDPHTVGPRGAEAGVAVKVRRAGTGDRLRLVVRHRPLEKHDGLQVELPGAEKPFGFGVEEILVFPQAGADRCESVFEARPGLTVEVPLPTPHPDIPSGTKVYCASSQAVKRAYSWPTPRVSQCRARQTVDFEVDVQGTRLAVASRCKGVVSHTERHLDTPLAPARNPQALAHAFQTCFARLGDTPFELGKLTLNNPDGLFVPQSLLNELRRQTTTDLQRAMGTAHETAVANTADLLAWRPVSTATASGWSLKIDRPFHLDVFSAEELAELEEVIFAPDLTQTSEWENALEGLAVRLDGRERLRIALPVLSRRATGHDWSRLLRECLAAGWRRWELCNLGGWELLREAAGETELDITADWPLYATNRLAAKAWLELGAKRVTLCPEDTPDNWEELVRVLGERLTVVAWQQAVLARSANCVMAGVKGECPGQANCHWQRLRLVNQRGHELIAVNDRCTTVLLNHEPLDVGLSLKHLMQCGARHFRCDFLWNDYAPTLVHRTYLRLREQARG
ncbi:MAG: U32 family peptidase [Victivallales bacterium]|nr:U32 family peptidase [Victivallales bacterium]